MKKIVIMCLICFWNFGVLGQTREIDSLRKEIEKGNSNDTLKVSMLVHIGKLFKSIKKYDSSNHYFKLSLLNEGMTMDANKRGKIIAQIGFNFVSNYKYDSGIFYYNLIIADSLLIDSEITATALGNVGLFYKNEGKYDLAAQYYYNALHFSKRNGLINDEMRSLSLLGSLFNNTPDYDKAKLYFEELLELAKRENNQLEVAKAYSGIGISYMNKENFVLALSFLRKAISVNQKINREVGVMRNSMNVSSVFKGMENYDSALLYVNRALKIQLKYNDILGIGKSYSTIGQILLKQNKYESSLSYFQKSKPYLKKSHALKDISELNFLLSLLYEKLQKFNHALIFYKKHKELEDSLFGASKFNQITELETKYETAKKDSEIKLLNQEKKLANQQLQSKQQELYFAIIVILLIILILLIGIYYYRKSKLQNRTIAKQNKELSIQKSIVEKQKTFQNTMLGEFAHDLKSPVTSLRSLFNGIDMSLKNGDYKEALRVSQYVSLQGERFGNRLMKVLDWAVSNLTGYKLDIKNLWLNELIENAISLHATLAAHKSIIVNNNTDKSLEALADKETVSIILNNLIDNAVKYAPDGSTIIISSEESEDDIAISITNPFADKAKPFTQKDFDKLINNSSDEVKGLKQNGLYSAYNHAVRNNGTLTVDNDSESVTFKLTIPKQ